MNKASLLIVYRSLFSNSQERNISTMGIICFAGIFIGSFALALVTAIMNGFQHEIHKKLQGTHAQVIISAQSKPLNVEAMAPLLDEATNITHWSPSTIRYGMITSEYSELEAPSVTMIKGIDPEKEASVSILQEKLTAYAEEKTLESLLTDNTVVIGNKLAQSLNVEVGDTVSVIFSDTIGAKTKKPKFSSRNVIVSGIFSIGVEEFDSGLILCSFDLFDDFFPSAGVEQINIKLEDKSNEQEIITHLQNQLGLDVYSWKALYPALVSALRLEKYVTFFVLALITLVASMNIISLLFMQITNRRPDIAILRAMGMSNQDVSSIFISMSMLQSAIATIAGLICAILSAWFLDTYPFITLPDAYYVSQLPVEMTFGIIFAVFITVMSLCFLATYIPAQTIKRINISHVLRFEG